MHILLLSTFCFGKATANGICANNIKKALINEHCSVTIAGFDENNSCYIAKENEICVGESLLHKTSPSNYIGKIIWALSRCFRPSINYEFVNRYYKIVKDYCCCNHVDLIISFYFPLETVLIGERLKKELNIQHIIYELDTSINTNSFSNTGKNKAKLSFFYRLSVLRWLKKRYGNCDYVFVMKSNSTLWKSIFNNFVVKMVEVDIPMLCSFSQFELNKDKTTIDFVYTGLLDSRLRSPAPVLELFSLCKNHMNWKLHFFSSGDCGNAILEACKKDTRIINHGYVNQEELVNVSHWADFYINIGNLDSNGLPSKLIKYISEGKPIIHFSAKNNDICKEYLADYTLKYIFDINRVNEDIQTFENFVKTSCFERVPFDLVSRLYQWNTPEFSVTKIIECYRQEAQMKK